MDDGRKAVLAPLPSSDVAYVVETTSDLWAAVEGERFLITGGTGFIGSWLLETFLAAVERFNLRSSAVVLTRDPDGFIARSPHIASHDAISLLEGDVRTCSFPRGEFRAVIHAATDASALLNDQEPLAMFDTIVAGSRRVLDLAVGAGVSRFLLLSSGAVYGRQPPSIDRIDEEFGGGPVTLDPGSAYAEGKRAAEVLCAVYGREHPSLQISIARCFAFVGPRLPIDRHFAIGNFIADVLAGRSVEVRGDGTPLRSYLYAADLAIWLWTILFRGRPLRPYNVGSEVAHSIVEVAKATASAVEPRAPVIVRQPSSPGVAAERYVPSTRRAQNELGLREMISLDEAINKTIAWHRSQT